jgi:hypothetical protein
MRRMLFVSSSAPFRRECPESSFIGILPFYIWPRHLMECVTHCMPSSRLSASTPRTASFTTFLPMHPRSTIISANIICLWWVHPLKSYISAFITARARMMILHIESTHCTRTLHGRLRRDAIMKASTNSTYLGGGTMTGRAMRLGAQ